MGKKFNSRDPIFSIILVRGRICLSRKRERIQLPAYRITLSLPAAFPKIFSLLKKTLGLVRKAIFHPLNVLIDLLEKSRRRRKKSFSLSYLLACEDDGCYPGKREFFSHYILLSLPLMLVAKYVRYANFSWTFALHKGGVLIHFRRRTTSYIPRMTSGNEYTKAWSRYHFFFVNARSNNYVLGSLSYPDITAMIDARPFGPGCMRSQQFQVPFKIARAR